MPSPIGAGYAYELFVGCDAHGEPVPRERWTRHAKERAASTGGPLVDEFFGRVKGCMKKNVPCEGSLATPDGTRVRVHTELRP